MDKSLRKLSRVELLELMVSLSEDYEELADENNRLKKMLAAQRLPRSTKVGSIAEAALSANGYFEAAQRSADDYLREIKHLRDELARRVEQQGRVATAAQPGVVQPSLAQQRAHASQLDARQAQARADQIIARANAQAQAIIANARARADETLANANRQSHAILSQAQRQAAGSSARQSGVRRGVQSVPSPAQAGVGALPNSSDATVDLSAARHRAGYSMMDRRL